MERRQARRLATALVGLGMIGASVLSSDVAADPSEARSTATPVCGAYERLKTLLGDQFDEHPASFGLTDDGTIMQVFASPEAGTWTILRIEASGIACVLATGQAWQQEMVAGLDQAA